MKKILLITIVILLLNTGLVSAHEHNLGEAKQLIDSNTSCDQLSDEQLETIGEYYMEQMHPGEAHETMDNMMGGEGSDSLKQMHISMAKRLYCNEDVDGMSSMSNGGMMMGGIGNVMGSGMMGSSMWGGSWLLWNIIWIILWIGVIAALILLVIWLCKKITEKEIKKESALEILKKRFAKGDITQNQYESMKKEME